MTQRCKITLDGVSLCPSENPRGFNVHVIKPYGKVVTHTYQRFDVLDDVAQVTIVICIFDCFVLVFEDVLVYIIIIW